MNMQDVKKYHGFLGLPRHSKLLMNDLGYSLFGFYIGLIMEAIWYRGNPQFGYITKTQKELGNILGCNQATISRNLRLLESKKYLIRHTKHQRIILAYLPLFLTDVASKMHSKNYADMHELYADMYRINADVQDKYARTQEIRAQKHTQRLYSSFNDNLGSFDKTGSEEIIDK